MPLEGLPLHWDVIVVGAGVAGSAAAMQAARAGLRVLLVEKSAWPRDKVCGGCLNAAALRELSRLGVSDLGGRSLTTMLLAARGCRAVFPLPPGLAITRQRLDAALVDCATRAGARFLPATRASLGEVNLRARAVRLRRDKATITVETALVLDCSGLAGRLYGSAEPGDLEVMPNAYIGLGATRMDAPPVYRAGTIHMACAAHGYVGLVRAADGSLNVGAALDPAWVKAVGGPAQAICATLNAAGFPLFEALRRARWHGTPRLTCRRRLLGSKRLFILGDATGYVEPFTGEGMAWALADAAAIQPFVQAAVACWRDELPARWSARHRATSRARRRVCRVVSGLLRHPRLLATAFPVLAAVPAMAAPLTAWLNHDFRLDRATVK